MTLTKAQVQQFRENGWLAPLDVLDPVEVGTVLAQYERAEVDHAEHLHAENRNNAHLILPFLADLAKDPRIVSAVSALVGTDITLWSTVMFVKEPHSGSFVSWHQDAKYMALSPDNFVTAWLALTPSTPENGCVAVIPGTHHAGARPHEDTYGEDNILTRGQNVPDVDEDAAVDLVLRPGQMSLHHPWLVHGSRPNATSQRRIGLALQAYLGADVVPEHGAHHVMHIAGRPVRSEFVESPPPQRAAGDVELQVRKDANQAFSDVLYRGAEIRRAL
jgi:ectoine hydroxylase-related dioxygenase (phytanoyl-CoA dioxygenase family)